MSVITSRDPEDDALRDGCLRPGDDTSVSGAAGAQPSAPPKVRTKRPRPTFEDGALTRIFKFPSKTYPRSTYYVTSTEIIIRIRKARKRWKLVVPKKRLVSYRTNRWFAKPRWVEIELTFTQASRLGLVPPRVVSPVAAENPAGIETPMPSPVEEGGTSFDFAMEGDPEQGPEAVLELDAKGDDQDGQGDFGDDDAAAAENVPDALAADQEAPLREQMTFDGEAEGASDESEQVEAREPDLAPAETDTFHAAEAAPGPSEPATLDHGTSFDPAPIAVGPSPWLEEAARAADAAASRMAVAPLPPIVISIPSASELIETSTAPPLEDVHVTATLPVEPSEAVPQTVVTGDDHVISTAGVETASQEVPKRRAAASTVLLFGLLSAAALAAWLSRGELDRSPAIAAVDCARPELVLACAQPIETGSISRPEAIESALAREKEAVEVYLSPAHREMPRIEERAEAAVPPQPSDIAFVGLPPIALASAAPFIELVPAIPPPALHVPAPASVAPAAPVAQATPVQEACRRVGAAARSINVQFEYASAALVELAAAALSVFADQLRQCPSAKVVIEGHTDSDGDLDRNQALSVRRAQAVQEHMLSAGVKAEQLSVVGFGPFRPFAPNVSVENKRSNRRAALVVEPM